METENTVNAVQVGVVDQQQNTSTVTESSVNNVEVATPQQANVKPTQSVQENQAFADMRRKLENANKLIGTIYGEHGINDIETLERQYNENLKAQQLEQQSQELGASPELLSKIQSLENEMKQRKFEDFKSTTQKEIQSIAEIAVKDGVDFNEEFQLQLLEFAIDNPKLSMKQIYKLNKPDLDMEASNKKYLNDYIENLRNGKAPVEGGGSATPIVSETPKTFKEASANAKKFFELNKK